MTKKPYVEAAEKKESETDEVVAMEAWMGYLKRNRSIIVDVRTTYTLIPTTVNTQSCIYLHTQHRHARTHSTHIHTHMHHLDWRFPGFTHQLFQGQLRSTLTCCACGHNASKFDPFLFLSLPIGFKKKGPVTLEECIAEFSKEEYLEGDDSWRCPKCKVLHLCVRQHAHE